MLHLWEVNHPYYCNEGNYFANDCGDTYGMWSDFHSEYNNSDFDMNLVFRFDWQEGEDWGAGEFTGDVNYRNGKLLIFFGWGSARGCTVGPRFQSAARTSLRC
jgi:hypothetical protein